MSQLCKKEHFLLKQKNLTSIVVKACFLFTKMGEPFIVSRSRGGGVWRLVAMIVSLHPVHHDHPNYLLLELRGLFCYRLSSSAVVCGDDSRTKPHINTEQQTK